MRLLKTTASVLLALMMLGLVAAPMTAQGDEPAEGAADLSDLEGIQKSYSRTFVPDMMAMFDAATPDAAPSGWFALTTMAMEFDSEDNAAAGRQVLTDEIEAGDVAGDGAALEDVELDVDMDHVAKLAVAEEEGVTINVLVATAQDGTYVYAVTAVTFGEDPVATAGSVLNDMKDTDVSDAEETFSEDGTSEGGLWAKLPILEDVQASAPELIQANDEIVHPVDGAPAE